MHSYDVSLAEDKVEHICPFQSGIRINPTHIIYMVRPTRCRDNSTEVQNSDHCLVGLSYHRRASKLPSSSTAGYSFVDIEFIPDTESDHRGDGGGGLVVVSRDRASLKSSHLASVGCCTLPEF